MIIAASQESEYGQQVRKGALGIPVTKEPQGVYSSELHLGLISVISSVKIIHREIRTIDDTDY